MIELANAFERCEDALDTFGDVGFACGQRRCWSRKQPLEREERKAEPPNAGKCNVNAIALCVRIAVARIKVDRTIDASTTKVRAALLARILVQRQRQADVSQSLSGI